MFTLPIGERGNPEMHNEIKEAKIIPILVNETALLSPEWFTHKNEDNGENSNLRYNQTVKYGKCYLLGLRKV